MDGNSVWPSKVNSTNIYIDGTAPTVVLSDDHPDAIVRDADTVVITATFTEANGIDESNPPKITIAGGGVSGATMTRSSNLVWTYSWDVPAGNGAATVSISAFDMARQRQHPSHRQDLLYYRQHRADGGALGRPSRRHRARCGHGSDHGDLHRGQRDRRSYPADDHHHQRRSQRCNDDQDEQPGLDLLHGMSRVATTAPRR